MTVMLERPNSVDVPTEAPTRALTRTHRVRDFADAGREVKFDPDDPAELAEVRARVAERKAEKCCFMAQRDGELTVVHDYDPAADAEAIIRPQLHGG